MLLTIAAEDILCEAVARRLASDYLPCVAIREPAIGLAGKSDLRRHVASCNSIARYLGPTLVLTDLDHPDPCPPAMVSSWLGGLQVAAGLMLRFAVMEVEAWILADRAGFARWLNVSEAIVPREPERESDPKRRIVQLARRSRSRRLRAAVAPQGVSGTNRVGPDYNAEVGRFVASIWKPEAARLRAPSLKPYN